MVSGRLVTVVVLLAFASVAVVQLLLRPSLDCTERLGGGWRLGAGGGGSAGIPLLRGSEAGADGEALGPASASSGRPSARDACAALRPLGVFAQAEADFARHRGGLSQRQEAEYASFCQRRAQACLTVVVLNGRLFVRHLYPGYQSRHRSTLHAIYRVALRFGPLPNMQFVVDVTDGIPDLADLPVFTVTRPRDSKVGILYPDFTFNTWPESVCPPERSHAYGFLFDAFRQRAAAEEVAGPEGWNGKEDVLFWRGGRIGNRDRDLAVQRLAGQPHVDVQFMDWRSVSVTGINAAPGCMGLLEQCKYKYLAFLNGNTYSSRFKFELLCGSCVFASRQAWVEWWSHLFEPGKDFVEVAQDFSDAPARLAEVRGRLDGGRAVAQRGRAKALAVLSEDAVDCYWLRLLELAAEVLPAPPADEAALGPSARPIEDVLLYPDSAAITPKGVV
mmetsp:Transcript_148602/g.477096  ORF Transcript_148602/g.477096 Transcript_148602/m.477096 type:complete len:446 (-) Transcript_148602:83-1420(-)